MNEAFLPDMTLPGPADDAGEILAAESPVIETACSEYLGRWNRLVSTTNWEKGRIVAEWREALIEAAAPAAAYSDEAWSRRVGSVTPQHTGRLRRVYQRFASTREAYPGLYWSHFQAAVDWDDAEMWLEGAVQNRWSIAQMQGRAVANAGRGGARGRGSDGRGSRRRRRRIGRSAADGQFGLNDRSPGNGRGGQLRRRRFQRCRRDRPAGRRLGR